MNGPQHFREAEKAIEAATYQRQEWDEPADMQASLWELARAQVHATLALAAATADPYGPGEAWEQVLT